MSPIVLVSRLAGVWLGGMCGIAIYNLMTARRLDRVPGPVEHPGVSLLIPARDEESTLRRTLPLATSTRYPNLEILVLDDGSTDGSAAVVEDIAAHFPQVRLVRGTPPPAGWLGKCWACHQLAEIASGEIIIFCDADVEMGPFAVERTIATMQQSGADVLTALPRQITPDTLGAAVVPLIAQLPVLATLPLRLVERVASPLLAMGNGQWIAFRRESYAQAGGHIRVKAEVVEDVALARAAKASGSRLAVALATDDLSVLMYTDGQALRSGFQKNLYQLSGGRPLPFLLVLTVFSTTMIFPLAAPFLPGGSRTLPLLLTLLRLTGVAALRHPWRSALLHPLGAILGAALALDSARATRRGSTSWKGRPIPAPNRAGHSNTVNGKQR
ncbi:glycosyltransferase family 2 protein [soil metagenome]